MPHPSSVQNHLLFTENQTNKNENNEKIIKHTLSSDNPSSSKMHLPVDVTPFKCEKDQLKCYDEIFKASPYY